MLNDLVRAASCSEGINGAAASATGCLMALLGVEPMALVYGLIGAVLAQYEANRIGGLRAVLYVALSTVAGAALGTVAVELILKLAPISPKAALLGGCLVGGYGAPRILAKVLGRAEATIEGGAK